MFQFEQVVIDRRRRIAGSALPVDDDALPAPLEPLPEDVRTDEAGPVRLGAVGLTVASSVGAWLELAALRVVLRRRIGSVRVGGPSGAKVLPTAALAGAVALLLRWSPLGDLPPSPRPWPCSAPPGSSTSWSRGHSACPRPGS